jgi:hypothetical protein
MCVVVGTFLFLVLPSSVREDPTEKTKGKTREKKANRSSTHFQLSDKDIYLILNYFVQTCLVIFKDRGGKE